MASRTPEKVVLIWSQRGALIASLERSLRRARAARDARGGAMPEAAHRPSCVRARSWSTASTAGRWAVQVCAALCEAGVPPRSIVVIVSAGDQDTLKAVLALGVSRFVEEPFTAGVLALQVAAAIHAGRRRGPRSRGSRVAPTAIRATA